MSIQKVPLNSLQKVQKFIRASLTLPETEDRPETLSQLEFTDDSPEPDSLDDLSDFFKSTGFSQGFVEGESYIPNVDGRWFVSTLNPGSSLIKLPGVRVKLDMRLVCYLYRVPNEGVGKIWAVPEEMSSTSQLESVLDQSGDLKNPPRPQGAVNDFMEAIEGDRSPASFLVTSVLYRELLELGASGQYRNWVHHRLIDQVPPQAHWHWLGEAPSDLCPKVRVFPDKKVAVEFFTCRVVAPVGLYRHVDQYPPDQYTLQSLDRLIAKVKH